MDDDQRFELARAQNDPGNQPGKVAYPVNIWKSFLSIYLFVVKIDTFLFFNKTGEFCIFYFF